MADNTCPVHGFEPPCPSCDMAADIPTVPTERSDTERLDYLQRLLDEGTYSGRAVLRMSTEGRGFRLHETYRPDAVPDVRLAIDRFIALEESHG
ncbi:MAG: hypothetical protein ACOC8X_09595 [Chloroflexota bacterium]